MYNNLDLAAFFFLFIGALWGMYKGFSHSLFSFAGKFMAAFLSGRFLLVFIDHFNLKTIFMPSIAKIIEPILPLSEEVRNLPLSLEGSLWKFFSNENISREINKMHESLLVFEPKNLSEFLSLILAKYILIVLSFLLLFLAFLFLFKIVKKIFDKIIGSFVLFGALNRILGFLFGSALHVLFLSLFLGFAKDFLFFLALTEGSFLYNFKILLSTSISQPYFYYIYSLIITEAIKLI